MTRALLGSAEVTGTSSVLWTESWEDSGSWTSGSAVNFQLSIHMNSHLVTWDLDLALWLHSVGSLPRAPDQGPDTSHSLQMVLPP